MADKVPDHLLLTDGRTVVHSQSALLQDATHSPQVLIILLLVYGRVYGKVSPVFCVVDSKQSAKMTDTASLLHVLNRGGISLPYFLTLLYIIYTDLVDVPLFVVGYAKNSC